MTETSSGGRRARRGPLHEEHLGLGAKLVDFGGWEMPLQYRGVIAEHLAVRNQAGLFDVSHLGKLTVEGSGAESILDRALAGKLPSSPWRAGYNLALTEEGGIVDDVFVYRRPEGFVVVPNAANADAVASAIESSRDDSAHLTDARERWAIFALQGPRSREVMSELCPGANDLGLHAFADYEIDGTAVQVARTGYTGEFGFELFVDWDRAPSMWRLVLSAGEPHGLIPAGLGARDTLRLEMGYPLHGNDIGPETNPVEAGMDWVIGWDKPDFRGKQAVEKARAEGPSRRLVGLVARGREIPRAHCPVMYADRRAGEVTSGNFSPVLKKGIALAYVIPEAAEPGTILTVDVRGRALESEVTKPPFVKRR